MELIIYTSIRSLSCWPSDIQPSFEVNIKYFFAPLIPPHTYLWIMDFKTFLILSLLAISAYVLNVPIWLCPPCYWVPENKGGGTIKTD